MAVEREGPVSPAARVEKSPAKSLASLTPAKVSAHKPLVGPAISKMESKLRAKHTADARAAGASVSLLSGDEDEDLEVDGGGPEEADAAAAAPSTVAR